MTGVSVLRRGLTWLLGALLGLILIALLLGIALDAGYFHGPLVKWLAADAQREIRVDGPLQLHLFSLNPRLVAERVTIGSPPWTPPGIAVQADKITVVFETPRFGRLFEIARLQIEGVTLHMFRDVPGHANWQLKNPDEAISPGLPITHAVSMVDAHVLLEDAQKNRQFDGTITVQDSGAAHGAEPLRIEAKGQLNGRPVSFELIGDPLRTASHSEPYGFTLTERSSGSHLTAKGALLKAFDLLDMDAVFEVTGADLRDVYYLTGTKLIDTGVYHATGKFSRRGNTAWYRDLSVAFGQSDIRGSASIGLHKGLSNIDADLTSQSAQGPVEYRRRFDLPIVALGGSGAARGGPQSGARIGPTDAFFQCGTEYRRTSPDDGDGEISSTACGSRPHILEYGRGQDNGRSRRAGRDSTVGRCAGRQDESAAQGRRAKRNSRD